MIASFLTLLILFFILDLESYEALKLIKFYSRDQGNLRAVFPLKEHYALLDAYFLGDTSHVSKSLKEAHRVLGLTHLFSPGGFHFHACFGLVYLFIKNKKLKWLFYVYQIVLIGLQLYLLQIKGLFPLKRVIPFQILSLSFKKPKIAFTIIFILDLFWGNFLQSPLSYFLSLGFWGIILFEKNFLRKTILVFILQVLCCYYFHKPFYILSLLGFILTPLISFTLPFILILYLMQFSWMLFFIEMKLELTIHFLAKVVMIIPPTTISYSFLLLIFIISFARYLSSGLLFFMLVFYAQSLNKDSFNPKIVNILKNKYISKRQ